MYYTKHLGFCSGRGFYHCHSEESLFPNSVVSIVIVFWLKWAGYLAVVGLNLLAQISDRISPYGV